MSRKIKKRRPSLRKTIGNIDSLLQRAIIHHQAGQVEEAKKLYLDILGQNPNQAQALNLLGLVAQQTGEYSRAVKLAKKAVAIEPDARFLSNLGTAYRSAHKFEQAAAAFQQALKIDPGLIEAQFNLAGLYLDHGRNQEAITWFRKVISLKTTMLPAHEGLGQAFLNSDNFTEALSCAESVLSMTPSSISAMTNKGLALQGLGQFPEAREVYDKILEIAPQQAEALNNIGNVLVGQGELHQSISYYQRAVKSKPAFVQASINLAWALIQNGLQQEAEDCFKKIIALAPSQVHIYSDFLFNLNYNPDMSPSEHFEAAHGWWRNYTNKFPAALSQLKRSGAEHLTTSHSSKKHLRLGFISPDFREHAVATFLTPLIAELASTDIKIFCYAEVTAKQEDETSKLIKKLAYSWYMTCGKNDNTVANRIKEDKIDILIDLAGHSAYNRLEVMAQKPAPIQASWLGYVNTTGLPVIDYRITDAIADPPGSEKFHSEKLVRLQNSFFCYAPPKDSPPVSALPAISAGHITFGSFNNLAKINSQVIPVWANILNQLPNANLLIIAAPFSDNFIKAHFTKLFLDQGIDRKKLNLLPTLPMQEYLELYNKVDIALDPFPHNGHTISCHTLWMGVPIITLRGDRYAGRMGASLMTRAGLSDLIAEDKKQYVNIAINLTKSIENLAKLRQGMRARLLASPICDAKQFACGFQDILRTMLIS